MPFDQIVSGVILPAVISGVILLVVWRPWRSSSASAFGDMGAALAITAGYAIGHVLVAGWPKFPTEPWQWLFYLAIAAAIISVIDAFARTPTWFRNGLDCLFFAIAIVLLLRPAPMNTWTHVQTLAWLGGLWLAVLAFWFSANELAKRQRASTLALFMVVAGTAESIVLVCSANAKLGLLAGVLTASIGPAIVVGWFSPRLVLAGGGVRVITVLFCGLMISGYFNDYSGLPTSSFLLVAAAPALAWLPLLSPIRRFKTWQVFSIQLLAVLIPAVLGAALAWRVYESS